MLKIGSEYLVCTKMMNYTGTFVSRDNDFIKLRNSKWPIDLEEFDFNIVSNTFLVAISKVQDITEIERLDI